VVIRFLLVQLQQINRPICTMGLTCAIEIARLGVIPFAWASPEIFPEVAKSTFCLSFSDWWRCNANGRSQNAVPLKKMPRVTATVQKIRFVGRNASFHPCFFSHRKNYVVYCYQQSLSSPVASVGALVGLAPKQNTKPPQIEIWYTIY